MAGKKLTHLNAKGNARMVDVGSKEKSRRRAVASATLRMLPATRTLILGGSAKKGDVLAAARIAGIQAAKRTSELIPLCHPLSLTKIEIDLDRGNAPSELVIHATVETRERTGVEMEALTAVSVAALTIYDMVKAVDRAMVIGAVQLESKSGGKTNFTRSAKVTKRVRVASR